MQKIVVPIAGMHCSSCEIFVENALSDVSNVKKVNVDHKKGIAEIFYDGNKPNEKEIEVAVKKAGYCCGENEKKTFLSQNPEDYKDLGIALFFLVAFYLILKNLGLTDINVGSPQAGAFGFSSLSVVFLVGITAGLSTCMALVGGLILGISARHAELHPKASPIQKFRPHIFFNVGRILGYAFLGGMLGMLGANIQFGAGTLGLMTIIVGIVMFMLGVKLIGIFPRLEGGGLMLPKSISKFFGIKTNNAKEYSHSSSMITGALTFFLPCGFTQAMQLYAVSTRSFTQGALIMGVFALGTAPGLLGVGGLASAVKGAFAKRFFKFAGILVIFLAMFNISNGYNLTGGQVFTNSKQPIAANKQISDPNVKMENGVQVVSMKEVSSGYSPNKFTIKKGVPVRWEIDAQAPNSCASSLVSAKLNVKKTLVAGKNVIEFTPTESGKIPFSCSMGMYTGSFDVVDETSGAVTASATTTQDAAVSGGATCGSGGASSTGGGCGGSGSTGGGGCMGGGKPVTPSAGKVETAPSNTATQNEQIIKTSYSLSNDIQPNTFTVYVGQPVKLVIDVKENGQGCMSTITIPTLTTDVYRLTAGKNIEMKFTPTKKGVYQITCAMGVPRGTIIVE